MNTLMKFILFIVVVGLMGFGFNVGSYHQKRQEIAAKDLQITEKGKDLEKFKAMAAKLTEWEKAKKEFGDLLTTFQKGMALKDFLPSFLVDIERLTAEQRVRMNDSSFKVLTLNPGPSTVTAQPPKKEKEKKEEGKEEIQPSAPPLVEDSAPAIGAQKVAIQVTMEGRFDTLLDFFQQLTEFKLNKLVTLQRLSLSPKVKASGRAPVLSINFPMEAYMFGEGGGQ